MTNRSFTDKINDADRTGKDVEFTYGGSDYFFNPEGIVELIEDVAEGLIPEPPEPDLDPEFDSVTVDGLTETEDLTVTNIVIFMNLPTSDPEVEGQLWNNDGVLTVSEGGD